MVAGQRLSPRRRLVRPAQRVDRGLARRQHDGGGGDRPHAVQRGLSGAGHPERGVRHPHVGQCVAPQCPQVGDGLQGFLRGYVRPRADAVGQLLDAGEHVRGQVGEIGRDADRHGLGVPAGLAPGEPPDEAT